MKREGKCGGREGVFFAHSDPCFPRDPSRWHLLESHLAASADLARNYAEPFQGGDWAYLAGLWHDAGKYSDEFQQMIRAMGGEEAHVEQFPGRVDHSTAGAQFAVEQLGPLWGKLLAYPVAGHHAGLPDGVSTGNSCLEARLKKTVQGLGDRVEHLRSAGRPVLPMHPITDDTQRAGFRAATFIRLLFSALVDADFLDTEQFGNPEQHAVRREGETVSEELRTRLDGHLESLMGSAPDTEVNRKRREVLDACRTAAERPPGLFALTVPTGGGKTLASMAFALRHCLRHGLRRVVYVLPFTSIIEQNAAVFRRALGRRSVLEHHCHLDPRRETAWSRLATENWAAPVVVTTSVQFFESFFACRPSACRKLHNVARSVIVLDEAQALPIAYLRPCLALVRELVETYGCTVVLCTATQPSLEKRVDFTIGLENVRPIIPDAVGLYDAMRRVQVEFTGVMEDEAIAVGLSAEPRAMCIVNTRAHAAALYRRLGAAEGHFHLSALMCPTHRALRLWQIRRRLRHSLVCRVVSTQLVEAGVDLDFPMVYRAIAGFDAIAQAAGRCNREGRLSAGRVLVFRTPEPPPLGLLRQTAETAAELVERHHDPLHPDAVRAYFELHYWRQQDEMDRKQIMARLGEGFATLSFPFRQIAEDFRFIESPMLPVIVPWSRAGQRFVAELRKAYVPPPYADRRAQRYAVQIPRRWFYDLEAHGVIEWMHDRFAVLTNGDLYDANMGLQPRDPTYHPPESLISD